MKYIDEMYPWNIIDFEKCRTYFALRKERDKFLKSLQEMNHNEWRIHKRLIEAGGLGDTVYIYPARGGGRTISAERIVELLESGRDVKVVRGGHVYRKEPKSVIEDRDLFALDPWRRYLDEQINDAIYKEFAKQLIKEEPICKLCDCNVYEWKPIVRPDTYAFSNKYLYDTVLTNTMVYTGFKILEDEAKRLVDELEGSHDVQQIHND